MNTYLVTIKVNMPYPKTFDYRVEASTFGPAISRAIKLFRADLGRKKINELAVHVSRLATTIE